MILYCRRIFRVFLLGALLLESASVRVIASIPARALPEAVRSAVFDAQTLPPPLNQVLHPVIREGKIFVRNAWGRASDLSESEVRPRSLLGSSSMLAWFLWSVIVSPLMMDRLGLARDTYFSVRETGIWIWAFLGVRALAVMAAEGLIHGRPLADGDRGIIHISQGRLGFNFGAGSPVSPLRLAGGLASGALGALMAPVHEALHRVLVGLPDRWSRRLDREWVVYPIEIALYAGAWQASHAAAVLLYITGVLLLGLSEITAELRGARARPEAGWRPDSDGIIRIPFRGGKIEIPVVDRVTPPDFLGAQSGPMLEVLERDGLPSGASVLNVGAGSGLLIAAAALAGAGAIDATEKVERQWAQARRTIDHLRGQGTMSDPPIRLLRQDDLQGLGHYDVIVANVPEPDAEALDPHYGAAPEEIAGLVRSMTEHLAPGGVILLRIDADNPFWRRLFAEVNLNVEVQLTKIWLPTAYSLDQGVTQIVQLRPGFTSRGPASESVRRNSLSLVFESPWGRRYAATRSGFFRHLRGWYISVLAGPRWETWRYFGVHAWGYVAARRMGDESAQWLPPDWDALIEGFVMAHVQGGRRFLGRDPTPLRLPDYRVNREQLREELEQAGRDYAEPFEQMLAASISEKSRRFAFPRKRVRFGLAFLRSWGRHALHNQRVRWRGGLLHMAA